MLSVEEFRRVCDSGERVEKGAEIGQNFDYYLFEAQKILAEMNTGYHTPDQLQELFARLTDRPAEPTLTIIRPSIPTAARTSAWGRTYSSTRDAPCRIRGAS